MGKIQGECCFDVCLIVTSRGRTEALRRLFVSIVDQDFCGSIEVLFVNQGGDSVALDSSKEFSKMHVEFREIRSSAISLSAARNIGLLESKGAAIYGFPDDDCWYPADFIRNIVKWFDQKRDVGCLCTNVMDPSNRRVLGRRPVISSRIVSLSNVFQLPISVGIFVRLETLSKVGYRFNEDLGVGTSIGSGEETEFVYRMVKDSVVVEYKGDLFVYHPVVDYLASDPAKSYAYGYGFGFLNGLIISGGGVACLPYFIKINLRSLCGIGLFYFKPIKRSVYLRRLSGCLRGFGEGFFAVSRGGEWARRPKNGDKEIF